MQGGNSQEGRRPQADRWGGKARPHAVDQPQRRDARAERPEPGRHVHPERFGEVPVRERFGRRREAQCPAEAEQHAFRQGDYVEEQAWVDKPAGIRPIREKTQRPVHDVGFVDIDGKRVDRKQQTQHYAQKNEEDC